jgi:NHLM bacteriocin system ABC transporter ATP-binding protein
MRSESIRLLRFRHGEQLLLSDPESLFRIVTGSGTVYISQYADGAPQRRLPGYSWENGQTFVGLRPDSVCLLAVFSEDTEIEEIPVEDYREDKGDLPGIWASLILHAQQDNRLFLRKNLSLGELPRIGYGPESIEAGRYCRFDTGNQRYAFCRVLEGTIRDASSDMRFGPEEGWFPVTGQTVLFTDTGARIVMERTESLKGTIPFARFHATCRTWMVLRVNALWDDLLAKEEERIQAWSRQERGISVQIASSDPGTSEGTQDLARVFLRILEHLGMEGTGVSSPAGMQSIQNESDLFRALTSMAEACGVRVRRVRLEGAWWEEDAGPLLAIGKDNTLLAALPERPGRYTLYTGHGIHARYDQIRDLGISPTGYMVYPALPDTPLTHGDVLLFLYHAVWKRDLAGVFVFACLIGVLATAVPVATGLIFSNAIPFRNYSLLYAILLILFMSTLASCIFSIAQSIAILRLEGRMGSFFEGAIWSRLLRLPPSFFRAYNAGNLASRMGVAGAIRSVLSGVTITVVFGAVFSIFNVVLMFSIYPGIALWAVALVIGVFFITLVIGYLSIRLRERLIAQGGRLSGLTFQLLTGIAKITAAGAENRAFIRWERELKDQAALNLRINTYAAYSQVFTVLWPQLLTLLIFALAGRSLSTAFTDGNLGGFLAFYAAAGAFSAAVVGLAGSLISVWNIRPLWDFLNPVLAAKPEDLPDQTDPGPLSGAVSMSNISFRYTSSSPPILDNLSLAIAPGEFVAIVGPSGSGKSTLLRLLLGFEKPDNGAILYDNKNLAGLNVRQVRKQAGVVLQDGQLMAGSIFENIAGSRPLSPDDAWKAAALAGIDADIREMPMGMHTFISEGSGNISGGQKQRLLIARAIASRPAILYLDEATSALDNSTQATVMQGLSQLNLTRIVIAHRLSTVRHADRIYVLEKGRVIEDGTYEELLQREGWFSRHAKLQLV